MGLPGVSAGANDGAGDPLETYCPHEVEKYRAMLARVVTQLDGEGCFALLHLTRYYMLHGQGMTGDTLGRLLALPVTSYMVTS